MIDNSISANARHVDVVFEWIESNPRVIVVDDGTGMTADQLFEAMRFGRNAQVSRTASDLGRFGLGLKTASLSQASILKVISRTNGADAVSASWDTALLEQDKGWTLKISDPVQIAEGEALLSERPSGTVVMWENLDRLLGPKDSVDSFFGIAETVSRHLGMVFHRYIGNQRLSLSVNGTRVVPWDPFKASLAEVRTSQTVEEAMPMLGCVLPAAQDIAESEAQWLAGPKDWLEQQGFYIYRHDRLLIGGGWLGLGRGEKSWRLDRRYNLARIAIDLTNADDASWMVDVRKTTAEPPQHLRSELIKFAELIRRRAAGRLRRSRDAPSTDKVEEDRALLWTPHLSGVLYRINRRHPLVARVRRSLEDAGQLRSLLDALERAAPVHASRPAATTLDAVMDARRALIEADLSKLVRTLYPNLRSIGFSAEESRSKLLEQPQMREHELLVVSVVEALERESEFQS